MPRQITISPTKKLGKLDRFFSHCVGAGRAHELLRTECFEQLKVLQAECGFEYIRFHGLLNDDMAVYSEDEHGNPQYNWQYIDMVFDRLLSLHIRPLVELSFMPDPLKSDEKTVFWWRGNVSPPASYTKWKAFIHALVQHFTSRYGADEVTKWYFEVWNEPDLRTFFFTGTMQDYFDIYDASAAAIKEVNPAYRIGGPATSEMRWIPEMIEHCYKNEIPIDFISTHTYGVVGCFDEFGRDLHTLIQDRDIVANNVKSAKQQILDSPMPYLPLLFTEWSASYSSRDNVHDSYFSAPFVLHHLNLLQGHVDSMSYWVFSDIFEEAGPAPTPFHGGFGLMNQQGLRKPVYYAYRFLCDLPANKLDTMDSESICAMSDDGNRIGLLFWDFTLPPANTVNEEYFITDIVPADKETATLQFHGLSQGRYRLLIQRVGYESADVYTAYLKMGLRELHHKETPTQEQIAKLADTSQCTAETDEFIKVDASGEYQHSVTLRTNDVLYLTLERVAH